MKDAQGHPRIGIITTHPAPYRDATFSLLCRDKACDLHVLFIFDSDKAHSYWGISRYKYPSIYLGHTLSFHKNSVFNIHLLEVLNRNKFDVLFISGHNHVTSLVAVGYALAHNIPYIYTADSIMAHQLFRGKGRLRDALVKFILKRAKAVWVPGVAAHEYMIHYGVPSDRIFQGSYCLDVDSLIKDIASLSAQRMKLRRDIGIQDAMTAFLMVGNMIASRRHVLLLKAFAKLGLEHKVFLILIGDGPERRHLESLCCEMKISNVRFYHNVPFDDLKYYYAASDAYVHSGYEPYSTALDYGAIAAVPLITTTGVGAAYNYSGIFDALPLTDPDDSDGLLNNMRKVAGSPSFAKGIGLQFRENIKTRNVQWAADQLNNAVNTALGRT